MSRGSSARQLAVLLLAGGLSLHAGSYTVKPVRIELSARQLRTTIQIQNRADDSTTIQAHVVAWNANGAEEVLTDNDEVLLNPPIFTIPAGHAQFVRLGLRHPPSDVREMTYRLILEEVPPPLKPGFVGITTLLKISVPIFVKPRVSSPELAWTLQRTSDQEVKLSVQNRGNAHVQIRKIEVATGADAEPGFVQGTVTYVLQNAHKEWIIRNQQLAGAGKVLLQAQTDNGEIHEDLVPSRP
jgi:fimbrial chaperone protein